MCFVEEVKMNISLSSNIDFLLGGGGCYIFCKSWLSKIAAHASVGVKFNL